MTQHLALISESQQVDISELLVVSAALQKQVSRDFGPIWGIDATVDAFAKLEDVPAGYWHVIVVDDVDGSEKGTHLLRNSQPVGLVEFQSAQAWSLAASHECLEMLCDPSCNRLVAGDSILPQGGRVEFLVEVCDPCQHEDYSYTVNGVRVSDFYTPRYFDPVGSSGVPYSFNKSITEPRQILERGYLSWRDPETNHFVRADRIGGDLFWADVGEAPPTAYGFRSFMDSISETQLRRLRKRVKRGGKKTGTRPEHHKRSSAARARYLRSELRSLRK